MNNRILKGTSLVGGIKDRERINNDYYATPACSVKSLLSIQQFKGDFLEPCVGGGHIANIISKHYNNKVIGMDIVDRGYEGTIVDNFLTHDFDRKFDNIITNPPFSLAQEFIEKSLSLLNDGGICAMFLKIQFLEGRKRKDFFKQFPPKYVAVFSKRQNPLRNGSEFDEKGKPWSSTMCFAWFVWEKGIITVPNILWI